MINPIDGKRIIKMIPLLNGGKKSSIKKPILAPIPKRSPRFNATIESRAWLTVIKTKDSSNFRPNTFTIIIDPIRIFITIITRSNKKLIPKRIRKNNLRIISITSQIKLIRIIYLRGMSHSLLFAYHSIKNIPIRNKIKKIMSDINNKFEISTLAKFSGKNI